MFRRHLALSIALALILSLAAGGLVYAARTTDSRLASLSPYVVASANPPNKTLALVVEAGTKPPPEMKLSSRIEFTIPTGGFYHFLSTHKTGAHVDPTCNGQELNGPELLAEL